MLLGNYTLRGLALHQAVGELQRAGSCLTGKYNLQRRFRFIIFFEHAPLFEGFRYIILNTPFHVAIPFHHIS